MPEWIIAAAASVWGLVMALAPVLQIIRLLRRRSSEDVSLVYFCLLVPGFLLWVAHGITTGDVFLVVPNTLAAVTGTCLIVVILWLRHDPATKSTHPFNNRESSRR